jgi:hypothetical protein
MEKVIRNGQVAVLYSPGYGAGWYTWNPGIPGIVFHPTLVELVEQERSHEITQELCKSLLGLTEDDHVCVLGASDLCLMWLPIGTPFRIEEYDGSESILTVNDLDLIA